MFLPTHNQPAQKRWGPDGRASQLWLLIPPSAAGTAPSPPTQSTLKRQRVSGPVFALAQMWLGTSEPLRVVLDGAQSRAVPQATVDHRINGQKVRNRGCEQVPL